MKKWLLIIIFVINIVISFYAISANYVTFAKVYPDNITFDMSNYNSVQSAIIKAYYTALEKGREIFGTGSFIMVWLVLFNFLIIVFLTLKCCKTHNK